MREASRDGIIFACCASVILVPAGIALRSWLLPVAGIALVYLLTVTISALPGWARRAVATVAAVTLGVALIGFGWWGIVTFEPHCVSSPTFECFDTVEEQRIKSLIFALLVIGAGVFVLGTTAAVLIRQRRAGGAA
jgi:hypothetical protein